VKKWFGLSTLSLLLTAGALVAMPPAELNVNDYEIMDLDFLRTRYTEIDNGRSLQTEGTFQSLKWLKPYEYREILRAVDFDVREFHLLQFTIKHKDDFHYVYPILLFHVASGELTELEGLQKGDGVRIFGRFYNLRGSEFMINVDALKRIRKGGHSQVLLLDSRVSPTPTQTPTVTSTPGPNLWQRLREKVDPKETPTPTGTITPPAR
jgi:hypothetical protein